MNQEDTLPAPTSWHGRIREWTRVAMNQGWMRSVNWLMTCQSRVACTPLVPNESLPFVAPLETQWRAIRAELDRVLAIPAPIPALSDIEPGQYRIAGDSGWHSFFLFGFGEKSEVACRICPETTRLLEEIPGLQSAFFSVLKPGKSIPEHRGVYRGFLRGHLGLIVPEGRCGLRFQADGIEVGWQEGKAFVFDDSYPHDVENKLDTTRVVLLFDFRRPMGFPMAFVNRFFLGLIRRSSFVQDALANQREWEARTLAAWEAQEASINEP